MDGGKILAYSFLLVLLVVHSRSQSTGVRLVGGSVPNEGRVEVYYNGTWGTVCDDNWSRTDANVVCRMLGYSGAASAHGSAYFGQGTASGRIWLDEVGCSGSENSLFDCNHRPWGYHDCHHFEDAGVVCDDLCPCPRTPSNGYTRGCAGNGNRVSYSCRSGYHLVGNSSRTCTSSGVWSGTTPTCQPATVTYCRCPQSPSNGFTTGCTRPGRGNLVTYNCYYGYELVGGDKTRRCLPSGSWSGSTPYCSLSSTTSSTFTTDSDTRSNLQLAEDIIAVIVAVPTFLCCVMMCIVGCLCATKRCHDNARNNARNRHTSTFPLQQTRMAGNRQTQPRQNPQTIGITPLAMGTRGENQEHVFTGPNSDLPSYVTVVCHPDEFKEVYPQDPSSPRGPLPSYSGPGEHPPSYSDGGSIGGSVGGCDD